MMITRVNSKKIFAESLLELAKSKPLNKITIKEISNNCSMTREAFYYHFSDRYELMIWIYEDQIKQFIEKEILKDPIIKVCAKTLFVMRNHYHFYKKAFEDPIFVNLVLKSYIDNITFCLNSHDAGKELSNPDVQFAIRFYANGHLNMIIEWILQETKEKEEILASRICAIMPSVLRKYYI